MNPEKALSERADSPREVFLQNLVASAREGSPRAIAVHGPRGWGKRTLLRDACERLGGELLVADLDLEHSVTNPDEFAGAFAAALLRAALPVRIDPALPPPARLRALIASPEIASLGRAASVAERIAAELGRRHGDGRAVVLLALELAEAIALDRGAPLIIAARSLDEFSRLTPFPGLGDAPRTLARWLEGNRPVRLIATTSPAGRPRRLVDALRREMGSGFEMRAAPPLSFSEAAEIAGGASGETASLLAVTGGRPLTVSILGEAMSPGASLREALARETEPTRGRLFQEMRFDYFQLLESTRGHAASRAILNSIAREEGLDLSGITRRLRRTVGSTLDYLRWLLEVDLLRRDGRRYFFADPLLRLHVLMHEAPEHPEDAAGRRDLIERFLDSLGAEPIPLRPRGRPPGHLIDPARSLTRGPRVRGSRPARASRAAEPHAVLPPRGDGLIEID